MQYAKLQFLLADELGYLDAATRDATWTRFAKTGAQDFLAWAVSLGLLLFEEGSAARRRVAIEKIRCTACETIELAPNFPQTATEWTCPQCGSDSLVASGPSPEAAAALPPGSGTFGVPAHTRQFASTPPPDDNEEAFTHTPVDDFGGATLLDLSKPVIPLDPASGTPSQPAPAGQEGDERPDTSPAPASTPPPTSVPPTLATKRLNKETQAIPVNIPSPFGFGGDDDDEDDGHRVSARETDAAASGSPDTDSSSESSSHDATGAKTLDIADSRLIEVEQVSARSDTQPPGAGPSTEENNLEVFGVELEELPRTELMSRGPLQVDEQMITPPSRRHADTLLDITLPGPRPVARSADESSQVAAVAGSATPASPLQTVPNTLATGRAPVTEAPPLQPGDRVGNWSIHHLAGRGGMGVVYKAHHESLDQWAAIKLLTADYTPDSVQLARFREEARQAASLDHPNIVRVFDFGEHAGRAYLIMQWVDGEAVSERIKRVGKLPLRDALAITLQAAEGLHAAHRSTIIHRDIKPDNLLIQAETGRLLIADFGLAKRLEADKSLTQTGYFLGTPAYIAPEQVTGDHLSPRSDIYALGATLFHMLTGQTAFTGNMTTVLYLHTTEPIPSVAEYRKDLPPAVDDLLQYMCAKAPVERPESMAQVIEFVDALLADVGGPPENLAGPRRPSQTRPPTGAGATLRRLNRESRLVTQRRDKPATPMTLADETITPRTMRVESLTRVRAKKGHKGIGVALIFTMLLLFGVIGLFLFKPWSPEPGGNNRPGPVAQTPPANNAPAVPIPANNDPTPTQTAPIAGNEPDDPPSVPAIEPEAPTPVQTTEDVVAEAISRIDDTCIRELDPDAVRRLTQELTGLSLAYPDVAEFEAYDEARRRLDDYQRSLRTAITVAGNAASVGSSASANNYLNQLQGFLSRYPHFYPLFDDADENLRRVVGRGIFSEASVEVDAVRDALQQALSDLGQARESRDLDAWGAAATRLEAALADAESLQDLPAYVQRIVANAEGRTREIAQTREDARLLAETCDDLDAYTRDLEQAHIDEDAAAIAALHEQWQLRREQINATALSPAYRFTYFENRLRSLRERLQQVAPR